jgi:hypothetical protein
MNNVSLKDEQPSILTLENIADYLRVPIHDLPDAEKEAIAGIQSRTRLALLSAVDRPLA